MKKINPDYEFAIWKWKALKKAEKLWVEAIMRGSEEFIDETSSPNQF